MATRKRAPRRARAKAARAPRRQERHAETAPGQARAERESARPRSREVAIALDSPEVAALATLVRDAGGAPIGAYREPLGGRALMLASIPLNAVQPTPFQRDLSPTHAKRLAQKIDETAAFLDPLIVVRGDDGRLWTPNGRHRLAAAKVLGLRQITALISPDESLAYRILALNTEKAHNLRTGASRSSAWHAPREAPEPGARSRSSPRSSRPRSCSRWASCTRSRPASPAAPTARS